MGKQLAYFFGGPHNGQLREVRWPLEPRVELFESVPDGLLQDVYVLRDYGVKLVLQEERYVRVYVHDSKKVDDPSMLRQISVAYGWQDLPVPR